MVEGQLEPSVHDPRDGNELCRSGIRAAGDALDLAEHREIRDSHDVHARVAVRIAVGAELPEQVRAVDARLFQQLPLRRLVERLVGPLEASGDRPHPREWRHPAPDEQDVQSSLLHRQDDDVDGDGERRELVRVVCFSLHDHYLSR